MRYGVCPDLKGERHVEGWRVSYDTIPLPKELDPHKQDLGTGLSACRRLLDSGELDAARERLKGIEWLVEDMACRGDPDRRRGKKVVAGASKSGKMRRKADTPEIIAYVKDRHTYRQAARKFGRTRDAVAKLVHRVL